jgi:hypothetical protein
LTDEINCKHDTRLSIDFTAMNVGILHFLKLRLKKSKKMSFKNNPQIRQFVKIKVAALFVH